MRNSFLDYFYKIGMMFAYNPLLLLIGLLLLGAFVVMYFESKNRAEVGMISFYEKHRKGWLGIKIVTIFYIITVVYIYLNF